MSRRSGFIRPPPPLSSCFHAIFFFRFLNVSPPRLFTLIHCLSFSFWTLIINHPPKIAHNGGWALNLRHMHTYIHKLSLSSKINQNTSNKQSRALRPAASQSCHLHCRRLRPPALTRHASLPPLRPLFPSTQPSSMHRTLSCGVESG